MADQPVKKNLGFNYSREIFEKRFRTLRFINYRVSHIYPKNNEEERLE